MRPDEIEKIVLDLITRAVPRRYAASHHGIRPDMQLQADLGIDSLALAAMIFKFEEACKVELSIESLDVGQLRTVGDMVTAGVALVLQAQESA
jgi:acyl carrier protein